MARCAFCEARKGKRQCPALGGTICPSCCGENRLRSIDCPPDCPWLGGLRAIADPSAADMEIPDEAWESAQRLLFSALTSGRGRWFLEAADRVFGVGADELEDWEATMHISYAALAARDADGKRHIDHVFDANARNLQPAEVATLECLRRSWVSLFEVTAVHVGTGLELLDLLTGDAHSVSEVTATAQARRGDILLAWLGNRGGELEITSGVCRVPSAFADQIVPEVKDKVAQLRRERPDADIHRLVAELSWHPVARIKELSVDWRPELRTMDGDEMLWCEARFDVSDADRARRELARCPDIEEDDEGFAWLESDETSGPGGMPRLLGSMTLDRDGLVLSTHSRRRLDRGRAMLEERLGDLITHRSTTTELMDDVLELAEDEEPLPEADELPDDIKREATAKILRDHYTAWLDEPVPALDGRTPRQAARDPERRQQVTRMLDDIEDSAAEMPGGETLDVTWMRGQLGLLDDLRELGLGYDPDDPPDPDDWLALDEGERMLLVKLAHASTPDMPEQPGSPRLHAAIHVMVENQLAMGEPQIARTTLDRLMADGVPRHDALHAVGSVVAEMIHTIMDADVSFNERRYAKRLKKLRARDWIPPDDD